MTFQNIDGVFVMDTGSRLVASTSSHTVEMDKSSKHIRLTFGVVNEEFEEGDIDFYELIKLLPR